MHRILLTIAYEGTDFCGWQVQPDGRSVQKTIQDAVEDLVGEKVDLTGASRTDAGVHARGQAAVFDTTREIPAERYAPALNQRLPEDVAVQSSVEVPPDFHPRYQQVRKTYEYRILNARMPLPQERRWAWQVRTPLDLRAMRRAGELLVGEHDFGHFCSQKAEVSSTVRTIYSLDIVQDGSILTLRITGNGFLYNMVRIVAGMLVEAGRGKMGAAEVQEALAHPGPGAIAPTAPAKGLTLVKIEYPEANLSADLCRN